MMPFQWCFTFVLLSIYCYDFIVHGWIETHRIQRRINNVLKRSDVWLTSFISINLADGYPLDKLSLLKQNKFQLVDVWLFLWFISSAHRNNISPKFYYRIDRMKSNPSTIIKFPNPLPWHMISFKFFLFLKKTRSMTFALRREKRSMM